ncbi:hypothetical protein DOY81_009169, partial [Sarcophaga bullata]
MKQMNCVHQCIRFIAVQMKNRLLYNLADCGIETNVDRHTKKMRIKEWIESSVITEEDEEELDE